MNLRQYKKKAKRVRDILISEFGCAPSDFWYPKDRREFDIVTMQDVDCKDRFDCIPHRLGVPVYLPGVTDYWGEANEPKCCIDLISEDMWWAVCGDSYIRKDLAAEARQLEGTTNDNS